MSLTEIFERGYYYAVHSVEIPDNLYDTPNEYFWDLWSDRSLRIII